MDAFKTKRNLTDREIMIEELRWKKFECLDDGFICLVDLMGDDSSVVQAARVSYGEGTKSISDDRTLIRYLMRHRHTTPFEMAEVKFLIRCPMDLWRQWIRHRTANVNEYSTRYSVAIDSAQKTGPGEWRLQADSNKQGSTGFLKAVDPDPEKLDGGYLSQKEARFHKDSRDLYQERIDAGIAREQARKDLPLSTYTEAYWKCDLHNILHFLGLRMDGHAQKEIREYATAMGEKIIAPLFPLVWEAFLDYRVNAKFFSRLDIETIQRVREYMEAYTGGQSLKDFECNRESVIWPKEWQSLEKCREREECLAKLQLLELAE